MKNNDFEDGSVQGLKHERSIFLTVSFEGTGAGTAWISGNYIIIDITTVAQHTKYINLSTPIDFDVLNFWSIHGNGTANATLQLLNTATAISDAVAVTTADKSIDRCAEISDAAASFAVGENDLRIEVGTAAFLGKIVIEIDR